MAPDVHIGSFLCKSPSLFNIIFFLDNDNRCLILFCEFFVNTILFSSHMFMYQIWRFLLLHFFFAVFPDSAFVLRMCRCMLQGREFQTKECHKSTSNGCVHLPVVLACWLASWLFTNLELRAPRQANVKKVDQLLSDIQFFRGQQRGMAVTQFLASALSCFF